MVLEWNSQEVFQIWLQWTCSCLRGIRPCGFDREKQFPRRIPTNSISIKCEISLTVDYRLSNLPVWYYFINIFIYIYKPVDSLVTVLNPSCLPILQPTTNAFFSTEKWPRGCHRARHGAPSCDRDRRMWRLGWSLFGSFRSERDGLPSLQYQKKMERLVSSFEQKNL